jgi:hypothetical protein
MISASYALLGLMSFLTAGETESRAWTIPIGSTALKAAGAIRAEVVNWRALADCGGYAGARDKGLLHLAGTGRGGRGSPAPKPTSLLKKRLG